MMMRCGAVREEGIRIKQPVFRWEGKMVMGESGGCAYICGEEGCFCGGRWGDADREEERKNTKHKKVKRK